MVARMNPLAAALAALAWLPAAAPAQGLPDPTRPPATLQSPAEASAGPAALQLQSVLLGAGRTPAAVISGRLVLQGGRVGDAKLVRVSERSAVLKGPRGETTLALMPPAIQPATPETTP